MNATVERIVELLFENLEMTEEVSAIKDEVMNNCQERFEDMQSEGMDEDAAIGAVVESLKGMDEVLAKYPRKEKEQPDVDGEEQELTFVTAGLNKITVAMIDRDVKVELSDDDQVHVICAGVKTLGITCNGGSLQIEESTTDDGQKVNGQRPPYFHMSIKNKNRTWNVDDFSSLKNMIRDMCNDIKNGMFSGTNEVTLQLPENFLPELNISAYSGDVVVRDVHLSGLNVTTASGDIEVELPDDVIMACVKLESKSGDVEATVYANEVSAQSTSGDVRLEGRMEHAKLNSTSGDVSMQANVGQIYCHTVSGDANLACESNELTEVSVTNVSGDINLTLPENVQAQVSTNTVCGDVNNRHCSGGNGMPIVAVKLNTVSGDMNIW